jgi:hypothetical protein
VICIAEFAQSQGSIGPKSASNEDRLLPPAVPSRNRSLTLQCDNRLLKSRCLPVSSMQRAHAEYRVWVAVVNEISQTGFNAIANFPEGISDMKSVTIKRIMLGVSVVAMMAGSISLASAQDNSAATAAASDATHAKPTKAERKAAKKEARAKKNAELKKLEDAGYQPAANEPSYPTKLQQAEKKAAGASQ